MSVKGGLPDGSRGRGRDRRPQEERWTPGDPSLHCVPVHLQRPRQQDQRQRFKMSSENNPFARDDGDFERKYKAGPLITFWAEVFRFVLTVVLTVVSETVKVFIQYSAVC